MDEVDAKIAEIRAAWDERAEEVKRRKAEALAKRLQHFKDELEAGRWKPDCTCDSCLRAVLTMDGSLVCATGRNRAQWWKL